MRTRLGALVLLPIIGVAVFGGREASSRARVAADAREVDRRIVRASSLLEIRMRLADETFASGSLATGRRFGLTTAQVSELFKIDLTSRERRARHQVDALIARFEEPGELVADFRHVRTVRAAFDAHPNDPTSLLAGMSSLQATMTFAGTEALQRADQASFGPASSYNLRRDLSALRRAGDATTAVGMQLDAIGQLFAPASPADRQNSLAELRQGLGNLLSAEQGVDYVATGEVRRLWHKAIVDPRSVRSQRESLRFAAFAPSQLPALSILAIVPLFRDGMARMDLYDATAAQAADDARTLARQLHRDANQHLRAATTTVVGLILAALALAAIVASSISRPLRALAANAGRVSAGDLSGPAPTRRGPRELVEVSTTLTEAVDNLRLVESQFAALATGELTDPILEKPVAGRLGSLLHDSVARLSHSMSEHERLSEQLAFDATHDPLTGFPNRASVLNAIRQATARGLRSGSGVGVLVANLDGFKLVNDTHGHAAGDLMLCAIAERIRRFVRDGDVVARIDGDEFAVCVEGVVDPSEVVELAERLVAIVAEPVAIGAAVSRVGASIGVAFGLDGGVEPETLLRDAGLASGRAKRDGGGRVAAFDSAMFSEIVRRAAVEQQLRVAVVQDELVLHYQPVVNGALEVVGAEVLLRWHHPDGELVYPNDFIEVAEASDLIIDIGRWVLRAACTQLARWHNDPDLTSLHMAVNLSGRHLLSLTVVDDVLDALHDAGADPTHLVIEITETVIVENFVLAAQHLDRLRALGVKIAIDDFGTGYTSLAHLRRLPADTIKIDRSLVLAAEQPADARVLELVVGAAHALGMNVVAEGIETVEQLTLVRSLGCDEIQGYLTGRPGPEDAFRAAARPQMAA
ncbi:MAG: Diguanylate cyclase protein [Actinomycetia bacterium]|nr:Diguanylate cyclase protein [Actinomycetes bacterium]